MQYENKLTTIRKNINMYGMKTESPEHVTHYYNANVQIVFRQGFKTLKINIKHIFVLLHI